MLTASAFTIGSWEIQHPTILAPMAGVTDAPFRELCRQLGAGMTVSEMITSDKSLWKSKKSRQRLSGFHKQLSDGYTDTDSGQERDGKQLTSVQLAGNEPELLAAAAQANEAMGVDIIDINMGCPAKKVCKKAAGSALLKDEKLVGDILNAVVNAVSIPVTVKIRTGWSPEHRNGVTIANIAQDAGISALAVHGRTRACAFKGDAEYDTIARIVESVDIPVFANGDINSPEKARDILAYTHASAVMIGRAAQGNPWIFREINHFLATGQRLAIPTSEEVCRVLGKHLQQLHHFYGEVMGVRIARKHLGWYLKQQAQRTNAPSEQTHALYEGMRQEFNRLDKAQDQLDAVMCFFEQPLPITKSLIGEIAA